MANYTFTSNTNSVLVDVDGKQAAFGDKELHPYTPDRSGDIVYLYDITGILKKIGNPSTHQETNRSKDRIPLDLTVDTIDVNGTNTWADAGALLDALRAIFFLASADSPLIPDSQRVNTFADLPDPVASDGQYWIVDQATGTWILGTRREAGIYKAVAGAWTYRGADVPYYLLDDQFTIKDGFDNSKQLGFEVNLVTPGQRRIATWQDKDIVVADANINIQGQNSISGGGSLLADRLLGLVNDLLNPAASSVYGVNPSNVKGWHQLTALVTNNAGQIKLNWTAANRPESPSGFTAGIPQAVTLNTNYTVSGNPTTTYPFLANPLIGGQNVIDNGTLLLRELLAGQAIIFRVKVGYINKGAGQNGNVIIRMSNPNPGSSFVVPKSIPTPDGTTAYEEEFEFIAIADSLSLDPLYGYDFEAETTFSDGNLIVYISEITAFYLGKDLFNKT